MAKRIYNIPDSLDKSILDSEIVLRSDKAEVSLKPLPVRVILYYILFLVVGLYIIFQTELKNMGFGWIIFFVITWVLFTVNMLKTDKSGEPQLNMIKAMLDYLPRSRRIVTTRSTSNAIGFLGISNIDEVGENGLVKFIDGRYGYFYEVVGSGSYLLFESDRNEILNRVDNFYRNMKPEYQYIFITVRQPQKVYKQIGYLKKKFDRLADSDWEIKEKANENYRFLSEQVGREYKSIHQYMIIKARDKDTLNMAKDILSIEVASSSLIFKNVRALFKEDIIELLSEIFKGGQSHEIHR